MKQMNDKIINEMNKIEIPLELRERSKLGIAKAKSESVKKSRRKWYLLAAPALAATIALSIAGPGLLTNSPSENPVIKTVPYSNAFDVTDPQRLVGWSDAVFVGKVIEKSGEKSHDGLPETQFKVEVSENIKGTLKGAVTVNQQGGYEGNNLILIENDKLLEKGETYLFVTKYLKEEGWYTLVPVYGDIRITSESHREELINKYKKAYEEEIPFQ
jgi:hypothetical protein